MRKTILFSVSAALIAIGFGVMGGLARQSACFPLDRSGD
jgi:hypothetical protein